MKSIIDFLKSILEKEGNNSYRKMLQNLTIFAVIGIALLLVGGFINKDNSNIDNVVRENNSKELVMNEENFFDEYDRMLQSKITNILSKMDGVGQLEVAITYSAGREIVPAKDIKLNESNTKEQDREGGVRSTVQTDTDNRVIVANSSNVSPVILKTIPPQVEGVVIIAQGARSDLTKVNIADAVATLLGISLSKVEVFPMSS